MIYQETNFVIICLCYYDWRRFFPATHCWFETECISLIQHQRCIYSLEHISNNCIYLPEGPNKSSDPNDVFYTDLYFFSKTHFGWPNPLSLTKYNKLLRPQANAGLLCDARNKMNWAISIFWKKYLDAGYFSTKVCDPEWTDATECLCWSKTSEPTSWEISETSYGFSAWWLARYSGFQCRHKLRLASSSFWAIAPEKCCSYLDIRYHDSHAFYFLCY